MVARYDNVLWITIHVNDLDQIFLINYVLYYFSQYSFNYVRYKVIITLGFTIHSCFGNNSLGTWVLMNLGDFEFIMWSRVLNNSEDCLLGSPRIAVNLKRKLKNLTKIKKKKFLQKSLFWSKFQNFKLKKKKLVQGRKTWISRCEAKPVQED